MRDQAELRGHHHVAAAVLDGPPDDFLAVEGAIYLGGVDVGDAQIERPMDGSNQLGIVDVPAGSIDASHRHSAQPDPGDVEPTQRDVFHQIAPFRSGLLRDQVQRRLSSPVAENRMCAKGSLSGEAELDGIICMDQEGCFLNAP